MSQTIGESQASTEDGGLLISSGWSITDEGPISRYDHVWSLVNFERKMGMENGKNLRSGNFRINYKGEPTVWYLLLYPNGNVEENKNHVSLYLSKVNVTSEPVEVEVIFWTINQQGVKENRQKFRHVYKSPTDWGFSKYLGHTSIILPGDKTLTIQCRLSLYGDAVLRSGTDKSILAKLLKKNECRHSDRACFDMCTFLESGEFSDCIVACGDKEFNCHKIVLAGKSPVFRAMFSIDVEEKRNSRIVIEDIDEDTVFEMIYHIYSGSVRNLDDHAFHLLSAADKYDLGELKEIC